MKTSTTNKALAPRLKKLKELAKKRQKATLLKNILKASMQSMTNPSSSEN